MLSILNPKDIHILVIGDIMLDIYNYGDANRISPEAPVPVFHSKERKFYLGGAANTYANLCSIGVNAYLFGVFGNDHNGETLKDMIYSLRGNDSLNCLLEQYNLPTISKERIIARSQQIVRVDVEEIKELNGYQVDAFMHIYDHLENRVKGLDAIIISDYGKGVICKNSMEAFRHNPSFFNTSVYVDPYPKHKELYSNAFCITPNQKEYDEMGGFAHLMLEQEIGNVIRTEGENGMTVFERHTDYHINTEAKTVYDVSGAGDTVIAVLAATKSMGFSLQDAVILANRAAGNVVSKMGTTAVDPEFIANEIKMASLGGNYGGYYANKSN
jgi:D-beta-D-heptose 7-phosphate kinase/D-beta-D-heptose 1-phosphate adenosyltransferase